MRKQSICMCVFLCLALIGVQGGIVSAQNPGDIYMWNFNEGEGTVVTDDSGQFDVVLGKPTWVPRCSGGLSSDRLVTVQWLRTA